VVTWTLIFIYSSFYPVNCTFHINILSSTEVVFVLSREPHISPVTGVEKQFKLTWQPFPLSSHTQPNTVTNTFIMKSGYTIVGELTTMGPDGQIYQWGESDSNCTVDACPIEWSVYGYRPSLADSAAMIALYTICMIAQVIFGWRYKTWGYMSAMLLGCISEIMGYIGRIMMWQDPWGDTGFIMQICESESFFIPVFRCSHQLGLITFAPVFFSAAVYVLLSQM
jgi:hypothetical protein